MISGAFLPPPTARADDGRQMPNVLVIAIDDLNDWVNCMDAYPGTVHTPNLDALAQRGRLFTNAHVSQARCGPSRNAILLGQQPWNTGLYENGHPWYANYPDAITIPRFFRKHGYTVVGAGKIFHQGPAYNHPDCWDEYPRFDMSYRWLPEGAPINQIDRDEHRIYPTMDWGALEYPNEVMHDQRTVDWIVEFLKRDHDKPFFAAAGIILPHIPWYAPPEFFDLYPLEDVVLPAMPEDDLDDLPAFARRSIGSTADFRTIRDLGKHKEAVQAYLACISYVDHLIGQMVSALNESSYADNTIVVVFSDHGFHLGEKERWHKFTLWERSTRVPLIITAPSIVDPGVPTNQAVGLIDLYPTLSQLAGLPAPNDLDGESLVPLLKDPAAKRETPVLSINRPRDFSVRNERWRYIRYREGSEELYDHSRDPNEWTNLASDPEYTEIKTSLEKWIPETSAAAAPVQHLTHAFDLESRTWTPKEETNP